jgi:hypothetical protein
MVYFLLVLCCGLSLAHALGLDEGRKPEGGPNQIKKLNPEMRLRLFELSQLPPEKMSEALAKWPRFEKMSTEEKERFLARFEEMQLNQRRMALEKAKQFGLTLSPEQEAEFVKRYTGRRLAEEKKIWEEMEPRRRKMESNLREEMLKEFGAAKP